MHIPTATYRIQFAPSFGFKETKEIVAYLAHLGISDIYASPIFKARKGSLHGYDVVDPNQLNPELGSMDDFEMLAEEVKDYSMGWLQDIVPNHMAFDVENKMLMEVLENGEKSEYFGFFDIDWDHPYESIRGRLLAPFLGRFYGECLEDGEIQLGYDEHGLSINYYNLRFPLRVETYSKVFTHHLSNLERKLGGDHPDFIKLLGIINFLKTPQPEEEVGEGHDQIRLAEKMLWEFYSENPEIKSFIDENIEAFNGEKGNPESFNLLDELLSEQLFRLSFWKVAAEETNYRRFFSINELISLKIEQEEVFTHTHSLIFKLIEEGKISGLRIDHIDGLYDPTNYLKSLMNKTGEIYIVVEKILDLEEEMPSYWPVQGTTGYEFMNYVNGIFCQRENDREFNKIYFKFTGLTTSYEDLVFEKKRLIIGKEMAGDIDNLAHLMKKISSRYRYGNDITLYGLKRAFVEVLALFPVYRTYINNEIFSETDQKYIREVIKKAKKINPGLFYELSFIEMFLLLELRDYLTEEEKEQLMLFVMRFQQLTGPLMAKGFEDTTLYVYNRLLSLNEVGGSPNKFGISLKEFNKVNEKRAELWPYSLNATSTHDTKRGEDVRARINVISEIAQEWGKNIKTWRRINSRKKWMVNGLNVPDNNDEYSLYQTLVGTFPFPQPGEEQINEKEYAEFVERIKNYIIKAVREAKIHTAWLKPDIDYEDNYLSFVDRILKPSEKNSFLKSFLPFQKKVAHYGIFNSLSQTLIKITSPGVPDFYQGTELWDLNLVDPDNRRPVDFEKRKEFLREIKDQEERDILDLIKRLISTKEDGRVKFFLIYRALRARREKIGVFRNGSYIPIEVRGRLKEHVVAFARKDGDSWAISIAPRLLTHLIKEDELPFGPEVWNDTHIIIPDGAPSLWKDAMTGQRKEVKDSFFVGEALMHFSVSLLVGEDA